VSEELTVLKEYYESLGLHQKELTAADMDLLVLELEEGEEFGLAKLVERLSGPEELLEYVGE
jgi:hypothetical protein